MSLGTHTILQVSALASYTSCSGQGHLAHGIIIDKITVEPSVAHIYFLRSQTNIFEAHNYFIKISADIAMGKYRNKSQFLLTLRLSLLRRVFGWGQLFMVERKTSHIEPALTVCRYDILDSNKYPTDFEIRD